MASELDSPGFRQHGNWIVLSLNCLGIGYSWVHVSWELCSSEVKWPRDWIVLGSGPPGIGQFFV